jgi:23S rRNA (adenine2503-C2)-methyltransferase
MKIIRNIKVPTGNILVVDGEKGSLECLSLGDYGKSHNIVCDFMGLDRKLDKVEHTELLPLEEKWVITCSTQYGCSQKCTFCDVPNVKFVGNATLNDLVNQVKMGMSLHPEVTHSDRINVHWARMGEPTQNWNVLNATIYLAGMLREHGYGFHPVVSTMMPKDNLRLSSFISNWLKIKNDMLQGEAGLQLSINSTNEVERNKMFNNKCLSLNEISVMLNNCMGWPTRVLKGRKITLNFAIADYEIDAKTLRRYFDPDLYLVKLTPMHKTNSALENNIETKGDYTTYYPYEQYEKDLKAEGFDVLVFIASQEEDESTITCGNAILGGSQIKSEYEEV